MEQYINRTAYEESRERQIQNGDEVDKAEEEIRQRQLETVFIFIQAYLLLEAQKKRQANPRQTYSSTEKRRVDPFNTFSQILLGFIVTSLSALFVLGGIGVAREFINNPQQPTLSAPPTATLPPRKRHLAAINAALSKELEQSRRNPDGRLYRSIEITDGATDLDRASFVNVRKEPQLDSQVVTRLPVGTVLNVDNIVVEGDDPYTIGIEAKAGKWTAFDCNKAGITKVEETPIPKGTVCTVSMIYAKPKK